MQKVGALVALGVILAVVPGCKKASESSAEKAAERAIEQATGNKANVDISGGRVSISGKEGGKDFAYEVSGKGGVALPKSFPADVPSYPGATVLSSMSQGNAMTMVTLQIADAPERVYAFYGSKLREAGWEIATEVAAGQMRMISGKKNEREANITVIDNAGTCTVTVVYSDAKG